MESDFPLNLFHLKYFVDAVESRSIVGAARRNNVTHSTISQAIKRFEESLGVNLLDHRKRQFSVTADAERIFQQCLLVLESVRELRRAAMSEGELKGKISFASSQSILSAYLLRCCADLKRSHKGVFINFEIGRTQEIKDLILSRKVEFGISIDDGKLNGLSLSLLKKGKFTLVGRQHVADFRKISGFVTTRTRPETQMLAVVFKKRFGKDLPVLNEVDSWGLVKDVVKNEEGAVGLVPDFVLKGDRELNELDWKLPIAYDLVAMHRPNESFSRPAEKFIELLRKSL